MKLYEINRSIQAILDGYEVIDEETGEIFGLDDLERLEIDREEKLESIGCYIKGLNAEAAGLRAEETALAERRKKITSKVEHLKSFMQEQLAGQKLKTSRLSVSYTTTTSVIVDDVNKIPAEYLRIIPEQHEADKNAIKAAMKAGATVDGAHLEQKQSMTIK